QGAETADLAARRAPPRHGPVERGTRIGHRALAALVRSSWRGPRWRGRLPPAARASSVRLRGVVASPATSSAGLCPPPLAGFTSAGGRSVPPAVSLPPASSQQPGLRGGPAPASNPPTRCVKGALCRVLPV